MSRTPAYELSGVRKAHGDSFALDVPRLQIESGETLCIVGPIGAGKSTLLRLLSGLQPADVGRISLAGEPIAHGRAPLDALRQVATVPQRPLLLTGSLRYNLEYGLRVRGGFEVRDGAGSAARCQALLAGLGLSSFAAQEARTLSGGQAQLLAIGRALIVEPRVLLLDEPTAHLDPANVARVEALIDEQRQRLGMTIVWATHNQFQARRMASRIAFLLAGQLIEVTATQKFFESPADQRTADFVHGKMVY